jgi:hypothetical protein
MLNQDITLCWICHNLFDAGIDNEKADSMLAAHYAAINKKNNGSNDTEPDAVCCV